MENVEKIYQHYTKSYTVTTDSRCITKDCVFVALKGEHFDGNDFARKAAEDGIAACVIADRQDLPQHERLFVVEDSLKTLQQLAKHHRENLDIPVIGITGTNGKTTTKELISAVLTKKYNIIYTQGNFNNHLGVPLTLLRIKPETEIAVVEMGANHPGEIRQLAEIAQPTIGIITNIGRAHLEGFGSYEEIIKTKFELYQYVHEHEGMLFVSKDDRLLMDLSGDMPKITYGGNSNSTINGDFVSANPFLRVSHCWHEFDTKLIGEYNFSNVMAAIAIGWRFGINRYDIHDAISAYTPTNGRSQLVETQKNRVILDTYNANPTSMELAIRNFRNICKEDNLLILGDMRELGADSQKEHDAVIKLVNELGFNNVILVGQEFKKACNNSTFLTFDNIDDLREHIDSHPVEGKDILVKGSNGMKLWEVMEVV